MFFRISAGLHWQRGFNSHTWRIQRGSASFGKRKSAVKTLNATALLIRRPVSSTHSAAKSRSSCDLTRSGNAQRTVTAVSVGEGLMNVAYWSLRWAVVRPLRGLRQMGAESGPNAWLRTARCALYLLIALHSRNPVDYMPLIYLQTAEWSLCSRCHIDLSHLPRTKFLLKGKKKRKRARVEAKY